MHYLSLDYIKEKWQHAGFQKYFKSLGLAFFGRIYGLLGSFFIGALVARYLGPERYGVLNYAVSFVIIFAFLANFGIDNILVRELVKFKDKKDLILNTAFSLKMIGALIVIVLVSLASLIVRNDTYTTILIFLYSLILIFYSFGVIDSYFQSEVQYKYLFRAQLVSVSAISLLRLFMIHQKLGTGWFVLSLLFENLVYIAVILPIFNKRFGKLLPQIDFSFAKKMLADSWPFVLTTAFSLIYSKIDQVMIGKMLGSAPLGIYSSAVKLAEVWYFVPALILGVVLPSIVKAKESDERLYWKRITKLFWFLSGLTFLFGIFEFVFAKYLVLFIFGSA